MSFHISTSTMQALDAASELPDASSFVKSRRYDVSITYDKYYQTPRIWLYGYGENGQPLDPEAAMEDVMKDYARKTVTLDPHPHNSTMQCSVHPCQHATAMLNIVNSLIDSGRTPTVDSYFFIFLKFMASVIPTIEYDFTMDILIGEEKSK